MSSPGQPAAQAQPLTLWQRGIAAGGASVVSAFMVNPLDVVKTRLQAQGTVDLNHQLLHKWDFACCGQVCVRGSAPGAPAFCGPACSTVYTGTLDGLRKIARTEGLAVLWRGTDVALMMAVPMVGVYLPLYDALLEDLQRRGAGGPLLAGTIARTVSVFCTAPLELVRTRLQAAHLLSNGAAGAQPPARSPLSLLQHLPPAAAGAGAGGRLRRVGSLWTGVGATLARDVPFSALYWGMVEPIRAGLRSSLAARREPGQRATEVEVAVINIAAGGVAGGVAAAVTCPFDVVKTRAQLRVGDVHPVWHTVIRIARSEGWRALFQGWSARSAKAAPACAIVLSAYEMIKHVYG